MIELKIKYYDLKFFIFFQFQENAAAWGREKAELLSKLDDIDQPVNY